ncbi:MAG: hypothetical protein J0L82_07650 [Deltaproteobacteria bacterium]|nr:hypothetical protein [Deltaproteobacteria bacterium]
MGEFSLSPMVSSIYLATGARQTFKLSNHGDQKLNILLSLMERAQSGDTESRFPTKAARLSHSQIEVPARGEAEIFIEYTGSKKLPLERAFRLIAKSEALSDGRRLTRTYEASVQVLLPQHSAHLRVASVAPPKKAPLGDSCILLIENTGTASAEMGRYRFEILRDQKWIFLELDKPSVEHMAKIRVLPKTKRQVSVRFLEVNAAQLAGFQLRLSLAPAN